MHKNDKGGGRQITIVIIIYDEAKSKMSIYEYMRFILFVVGSRGTPSQLRVAAASAHPREV